MNKHLIDLEGVSKEFGGEYALMPLNLYIRDGEFLTLLGPSGCGKTTMLRIIAGFEQPSTGRVIMDGKDITDLPPFKRKVNTVFQKYALFPHLNVYENIAFGLKIKKASKAQIDKKVGEMLELVGLKGYDKRYSEQLSGGQQQRVAIARALANEPTILLLDEPLGALDLKMRQEMQSELKGMQQKLGITFIYVTHDQEEALSMSDTIVVMQNGMIEQIGTPVDIYNEPRNAFVADFIGESNIIAGTMKEDFLVEFHGSRFVCVDKGFEQDEPVDIVIRPEDIVLMGAGSGHMQGTVTSIGFLGVHYEMRILCNGLNFLVHSTTAMPVGEQVGLYFDRESIHIMRKSAKDGARIDET